MTESQPNPINTNTADTTHASGTQNDTDNIEPGMMRNPYAPSAGNGDTATSSAERQTQSYRQNQQVDAGMMINPYAPVHNDNGGGNPNHQASQAGSSQTGMGNQQHQGDKSQQGNQVPLQTPTDQSNRSPLPDAQVDQQAIADSGPSSYDEYYSPMSYTPGPSTNLVPDIGQAQQHILNAASPITSVGQRPQGQAASQAQGTQQRPATGQPRSSSTMNPQLPAPSVRQNPSDFTIGSSMAKPITKKKLWSSIIAAFILGALVSFTVFLNTIPNTMKYQVDQNKYQKINAGPHGSLNGRGAIPMKTGQKATIVDAANGKELANWTVNKITPDIKCTQKDAAKSKNGHLIALDLTVQTEHPFKNPVTFDIYSETSWSYLNADGTMSEADLYSNATSDCLSSSTSLHPLQRDQKEQGIVVLDVPNTDGSLVYNIMAESGPDKWEYPIKPQSTGEPQNPAAPQDAKPQDPDTSQNASPQE